MSSHFDQYGAYLAKKTTKSVDFEDDINCVRSWLDDAPKHASSDSMASWGHLIAHLLQYLEKTTFTFTFNTNAYDAQRLHIYLETMSTLEPEVWWIKKFQGEIAKSHRPCFDVYEAFENVCSQLNATGLHSTRAVLKNLVEQRSWNPTPLLTSLNAMASQQIHYAKLYVHRDHGLQGTAQGKLLQALRSLVLDTAWRPCDTPLYGDTWLVHENSARNGNLDEAKRGRDFVQRFAKSTPSQTDKLITFISSSKDLGLHGIDDFFPLRLDTCQAQPVLHALIGILTKPNGYYGTGRTEHVELLLKKYHPKVLEMLKLHLSIFPEVNAINSMAELLVPGFNTLRGRSPVLVIDGSTGIFDNTRIVDNSM